MFLYQGKNIGRGVWGTKSPKKIIYCGKTKVGLSEALKNKK
jgi:hypothetical protein